MNYSPSEGRASFSWNFRIYFLFVRVREQGARIESIPLRRLVELSGFRKKRWEFKDGWLILEAF